MGRRDEGAAAPDPRHADRPRPAADPAHPDRGAATSLVFLAAFGWFFLRSRAGIAMRAVADSQQVAMAMGSTSSATSRSPGP